MKIFFSVIGSILAIIALSWALAAGDFAFQSFWKPKYRQLDNQVFKQSEQYNDGMVRDLEGLQLEYINADADHKQAIRAIVLHRFSVYPDEKMPANLQNFYNQLRSGK